MVAWIVLIDCSQKYIYSNCKSALAAAQEALLDKAASLAAGDIWLLFDSNEWHLCERAGEAIASLCNYKPSNFRLSKILLESINLLDLDEFRKIYLVITDRFDIKHMTFEIEQFLETLQEEDRLILLTIGPRTEKVNIVHNNLTVGFCSNLSEINSLLPQEGI